MGSVGLNFGSPTSGAGFDVATTVAAITANLQATETPYKTQLTTLQSEDTTISSLGTLMSTLSTDIGNLTSPTGTLASMEGSSSNENVLELTSAGTGAVAGSHTVLVSQLAQTSSVYASAVGSGDTLAGSLSIAVGTGSAVTVDVNASDPSLAGLAAAINAAGAGVTASVISGSAGDQLSLTSSTSGAAGDITVNAGGLTDTTTGSAVTFHTAQAGQDAQLTVDGIAATSSSNTVSTVIPGVTFQLLSTSTTPVQVEIANDTSSISQSISTLVTDYNAVVSALNTQEGNSASGSAEPLYGNPLIATLQSALDGAITGSSAADPSGIAAIGLSLNSDGTLTLDSDALTTALNANFAGVVDLFQGTGGVGQNLETAVTNLGTGTGGALGLAASENASVETSLNSTISTLQAQVATQTTALTASLNAANETLQLIPAQLDEVNELYSALSGYNQNSNG